MHVHSTNLLMLRDIGLLHERRYALRDLLWGTFYNQDPNYQHLDKVLDYIYDDQVDEMPDLVVNWYDLPFLNNLRRLKAQTDWIDGRLTLNENHPIQYADRSFDHLADVSHEWSLIKTLNYLWLCSIKPRKKIAVLTSVRNEGVNIVEWVAHYRVQGADSIFIYTNGNDDGSDELLAAMSDAGLITLIKNTTNLTGINDIQGKVFNHAVFFLNEMWDHEWVMYLDTDEFLVSDRYVDAALSSIVRDHGDNGELRSGICFNWKWFGSQRQLWREPGLLLERYLHSRPNTLFKTLARLRDVTGFLTTHVPRVISGGVYVDASLNEADPISHKLKPVFDLGQLNHYWNKSFEEFIAKRLRGRGDLNYVDFFRHGNSDIGVSDPPPPRLVGLVKQEIERIAQMPGVGKSAMKAELSFVKSMRDFDRRHNIAEMFQTHQKE